MNRKRLILTRFILIPLACIMLLVLGLIKFEHYYYPMDYADIVNETAAEYNLDPSLVFAIIHTESKFNENALSSANAKGLMQLTDDTFLWAQKRAGQEKLSSDTLFSPEINIRYGCYVLVLLSEQFDDIETVLAAYNAGQGRVQSWLENPEYSSDGTSLTNIPYQETADYVRRVLNTQKRYQQLYKIQ